MEQELFDKIIDLIIETKNECLMNNDENPLCWANDEGVELLNKKLQHKLWAFAKNLNEGGVA